MEFEIAEFFLLIGVMAVFGAILYVANRKKLEED